MIEVISTAFLLGLLSSLHCGGMCGGISGALTLSLSAETRARPRNTFIYPVLFNLGRIASYTLAGSLAGLMAALLGSGFLEGGLAYARVAVGGLMVLLALQLLGDIKALAALERVGLKVWRRLTPLYRSLLPVKNPAQAIALGMLWGWLPCGLVYTALAYTLTLPSATLGALAMAAFGAGTLPALLFTGTAFFGALRKTPATRPLMGALLLLLGLWTAYAAWPVEHAHHQLPPTHHH